MEASSIWNLCVLLLLLILPRSQDRHAKAIAIRQSKSQTETKSAQSRIQFIGNIAKSSVRLVRLRTNRRNQQDINSLERYWQLAVASAIRPLLHLCFKVLYLTGFGRKKRCVNPVWIPKVQTDMTADVLPRFLFASSWNGSNSIFVRWSPSWNMLYWKQFSQQILPRQNCIKH